MFPSDSPFRRAYALWATVSYLISCAVSHERDVDVAISEVFVSEGDAGAQRNLSAHDPVAAVKVFCVPEAKDYELMQNRSVTDG